MGEVPLYVRGIQTLKDLKAAREGKMLASVGSIQTRKDLLRASCVSRVDFPTIFQSQLDHLVPTFQKDRQNLEAPNFLFKTTGVPRS